jgi:hypothetical protein
MGMHCEAVDIVAGEPTVTLERTCLRIGDVAVALCGSAGNRSLGSELSAFRTSECEPDIEITLHWTARLRPSPGSPIFDSGAVWKLSRDRDDFIFDFASPAVGPGPFKQMRTRDFTSAQLIMNSVLLPKTAWPLEYPADELLITNYLAHQSLGVEVHCCGLVDPEYGGFLFLGHSGAGKSTTTRLWKSLRNPEILSDDRIILRLHQGELWMYGTPWHGEAAFASAAKSKLSRIFVLQHGARNVITPMSRAQAVGELFARCFPPFHSATGLQNTVEFLERVVETVPCYEFQFVPDASAVEVAVSFHG